MLLGLLLLRHAIRVARDFRERVRQGFTILRTAPPLPVQVAAPQAIGWICRVGTMFYLLRAFSIHADIRNALLVLVVGSASTLLPLTPGGVGTQQALIVVVLSGQAPDSTLLSFSVGMQVVITVANALLGFLALTLMLRSLSLRKAIREARAHHASEQPSESSRRRSARVSRRGPSPCSAAPGLRAEPRRPSLRRMAHGGQGATPTSASARSAVRPTGTTASGCTASSNEVEATPPARRSRVVGARLPSGLPAGWRMRRHGVPEQHAMLDAELAEQAVHDRSGQLLVALGPEARQRVRRAPLEQRALGGEGDAREASPRVPHRLACQHDRSLARALDEVLHEVRAPDRGSTGPVELRVLVGQRSEAGAELEAAPPARRTRAPGLEHRASVRSRPRSPQTSGATRSASSRTPDARVEAVRRAELDAPRRPRRAASRACAATCAGVPAKREAVDDRVGDQRRRLVRAPGRGELREAGEQLGVDARGRVERADDGEVEQQRAARARARAGAVLVDHRDRAEHDADVSAGRPARAAPAPAARARPRPSPGSRSRRP